MITDDGKRWHYLACKKFALLRGISSSNNGDLECLLKKVRSCQNNPKNSYTEKKVKYKPSRYAWCSICSFDETKNRRYFYRGKDCIEKFCKDLKELGTEIINFE